MKILYVIHNLSVGGAETLVTNYVIKIKARGEDVSLLVISHVESFLAEKVRVNNVPYYTLEDNNNVLTRIARRIISQRTINKFNKFIDELKPDIIHFHTMFPCMDKVNFPINHCVFTYHSRVKRNFLSAKYIKPLMDRLVEKKINFIAISSEVDNDIKQYFKNANSVVIPNGMDLEEIRRNKYSRNDFCDKLSIPHDAFLIGQVGRFNPVKNHIFTLNLFKSIIKNRPNSYLLLIGTGNTDEKEFINNSIEEFGLKNNVKLLGLRNDATSIMSCLDVILLPSKSEAFPLVMIEAQVLNIRCVSSDAIPDDIVCNPNCFRLSLDAPTDEWIETIMGNNQELKSYKLSDFDINVVIDKHLSLYHKILK